MNWSDYMLMAAEHSKNSASHWFRYLRKDIDKCGIKFTKQDVENLYNNETLTPFQRLTIRAAFEDGSPTRQYIISLNGKANLDIINAVRKKHGYNISDEQQ